MNIVLEFHKKIDLILSNYYAKNINTINNLINKMSGITLDQNDWSDLAYNKYALTINDIITLEKGFKLKVLCMHRNIWDLTLKDDIMGKSLSPEDFFKNESAVYVHEENLKGVIIGKDWDIPNFEFCIEYKHHCWYPLKNGLLPASDPQGFSQFPWNDEKSWDSFPTNTKLGYRGFMIRWDDLAKLPNIMYYQA
jgi:hypothetical protein